MFAQAIENVSKYTRPIHTISIEYGGDVVTPGAATLFFVNEFGYAVTCKHVAIMIAQSEMIGKRYGEFKQERSQLSKNNKYNRKLKELEKKYGYKQGITVGIKNSFNGCVDKLSSFSCIMHPTEDVAIIKFEGFTNLLYMNYAVFSKDMSQLKPGTFLCRLGFPFPEFTNYSYNASIDDIEWTSEGVVNSPIFPIDGMITRFILNSSKIELSTPGLRGQSGGPLFDKDGVIYGMQSMTHHLHLGFDMKDHEIQDGSKTKKVTNYPFLHLGVCVHADIIKSFLKEENVKYYEK